MPNQITLFRLALAAVFFLLLSVVRLSPDGTPSTLNLVLINLAFVVFVAAAALDFVDGLVARRLQQETGFGRVIDPFVDKMLVIGGFIFLLGRNLVDPTTGYHAGGVAPWMVVVILGRELLVSVLRGESEKAGQAFGANMIGKIKATLQFCALGAAILRLNFAGDLAANEHWLPWLADLLIWSAVLFTLYSLVDYVYRGRQFLLMHHDDELAAKTKPAAPTSPPA